MRSLGETVYEYRGWLSRMKQGVYKREGSSG
jgi:hypothetical protein